MLLELATETARPDALRRWATLLALIVVVGIGGIMLVMLLARRWQRRSAGSRKARESSALPDPWQEAANRVQPYDQSEHVE